MAVTLKEIARKTGLSIPTVSEVLREDPNSRLATDTRQKVLRVASELGYRRNIYARVLSTGKSLLIGLLGYLEVEVGVAKLQAIDLLIHNRGYATALMGSEGQVKALDELASRRVEGVITVQGLMTETYELASSLVDQGMPIVSVEPTVGLDIDYVTVDRRLGVYEATHYLIKAGHERIAFLHGLLSSHTGRERFRGYSEALEDHGIQVDESLMIPFEGSGGPESGHEAMSNLLRRNTGLTAVICNNDHLAFGAMRAIFEAGLSIPRDVAVVGFDDIPLAAYAPVPLTTVRQPVDEIARLATDLLFQRMGDAGAENSKQSVFVRPTLVLRESTAARK